MPAVVRVHNIVAPAHSSGVVDSITEAAKVHLHVVHGISSSSRPAHERRFVVAPVAEVNGPTVARRLVGRMAVDMLLLRHVNAGNLVAVKLHVPGAARLERSHACLHIELLTLVESDSLRICFHVSELIAKCANRSSLDGTILKLFSVGAFARRSGPNVQVKLLAENSCSFRLSNCADSCDCSFAD